MATIGELFLDYKHNVLNKNKDLISFKDMPRKRLYTIIVFIIVMIVIFMMIFLGINPLYLLMATSLTVMLFIFILSKDEKNMLQNYYKPYSKNKMLDFVKLLEDYNINIYDDRKINLLIEECDKSIQSRSILDSSVAYLKKVSKFFIIPILSYVVMEISGGFDAETLFILSLQLVQLIVILSALIHIIYPELKNIIDRDAKRYEMLKFDLRQLIIFRDMINPQEKE